MKFHYLSKDNCRYAGSSQEPSPVIVPETKQCLKNTSKQVLILRYTRPTAFPYVPRKFPERGISSNMVRMALKIYERFTQK